MPLTLLGGCATERGSTGAGGTGAAWFWGMLLVAGSLAFWALSRRLRAEAPEGADRGREDGTGGAEPSSLRRWPVETFRALLRPSSGAEDRLPLPEFSREPALIEEVLLQAWSRGAGFLLFLAPIPSVRVAPGPDIPQAAEADAGFDAPMPPAADFAVSPGFAEELESSLSEASVLPPVLRGTCLQVDASRIVIRADVPLDKSVWTVWAGRAVLARFSFDWGLGSAAGKRAFQFFGRIQGGHLGRGETLISLTRPARIERIQHRLFPRTTPEPEDVALGFWPWPVAASLPAGAPAGPPALVCGRPARRTDNARLENISASGVGLAVRREAAADPPQEGVLLLSLRQGRGEPLTLWLACSLRHATPCADGIRRSHAVLGYVLEAWSPWEQGLDFRKKLEWRPVAPGGEVPALLRWVLRDMAARQPLTPRFFNLQTPGASLGR